MRVAGEELDLLDATITSYNGYCEIKKKQLGFRFRVRAVLGSNTMKDSVEKTHNQDSIYIDNIYENMLQKGPELYINV